ncbi:hypothetical protein [Magnetospira sp. QH-2]|uniref:hypothetical protein n=1 Tax=Magnetospira sp. (strain QH-2) TaxID=1288970 RepID=UPI0003E81BC6|nr:hypothetical protein [Magnetospira sp. QH-2]CCQ75068.1 conserved exported protein of unknown function [Magnetospira sp. QH-2]
MIQKMWASIVLAVALVLVAPAQAEDVKLKPFVLAEISDMGLAAAAASVKSKLSSAGFDVVGDFSPYAGTQILVITNGDLQALAAKSKYGGYGAVHRVSLVEASGKVQVAYTNPPYWAAAFRMDGDQADMGAKLGSTLGNQQSFGAEGIEADELRDYHYKFMMPYFDDPIRLIKHDSHADAVAAAEKSLAEGRSGITKVYRVDIPGKEETVFGVAMDGTKGGGDMQDDAFLMKEIDFKDIKSAAHLPYEILITEGVARTLPAEFRIAISFPDLSMMGDNSFMNIMGAPDAIKSALTQAAGGKAITKKQGVSLE